MEPQSSPPANLDNRENSSDPLHSIPVRTFALPILLIILSGLFFYSCKKDSVENHNQDFLTVTGIKPNTGHAGDTIIITGTNFLLSPRLDTVKFNGVPAQVEKAKTDTLFVIVPVGNISGTVTVNSLAAPGSGFTAMPTLVTVLGVHPSWGKIGDTIIINGTNFSPNPLQDTVKMNGVQATVIKAIADTLYVVVPLTSNGVVTVNGVSAPGDPFSYNPPVVTTVAGSGTVVPYSPGGYADGPDSTTLFSNPSGICFDQQGNLLISDYSNRCIRKISAGTVSTYAGSVTGSNIIGPAYTIPAYPMDGIIMDAMGNIYVTEVAFPENVLAYEGYHPPVGLSTVQKISGGIMSTFAGGAIYETDGQGAAAGFYNAGAMTFDPQGNLYVAESGVIRKITPSGFVTTFAGKGAVMTHIQFDCCRFADQWVISNGYLDGQDTSARFGDIVGLASDGDGNIYATDMGCSCIRKVTPSGFVSYFALSGPHFPPPMITPGVDISYTGPMGICADGAGNLFVTEGNSIIKINSSGTITAVAGSDVAGYADGPAANALFFSPNAIAVDAQGNLYVSDSGNQRIRKISFH